MSTYVIGDVQGCFSGLQRLLDKLNFESTTDRLWFVGDLVNRGPESLEVLRFIKGLGNRAVAVLGNHDLYLLAVAAGVMPLRPKDTTDRVLAASDRDELLGWLGERPLVHRADGVLLVHAGLLPQWTIDDAETLAREAHAALCGPERLTLLRTLHQTKELQWSQDLTDTTRLAAGIHVFTRLRTCTVDGLMEPFFSGPPQAARSGFHPWFTIPNRRHSDATIICGHWAALGLHLTESVLALDSGCVYGRELTAVRLEDRKVFQVSCRTECRPKVT